MKSWFSIHRLYLKDNPLILVLASGSSMNSSVSHESGFRWCSPHLGIYHHPSVANFGTFEWFWFLLPQLDCHKFIKFYYSQKNFTSFIISSWALDHHQWAGIIKSMSAFSRPRWIGIHFPIKLNSKGRISAETTSTEVRIQIPYGKNGCMEDIRTDGCMDGSR